MMTILFILGLIAMLMMLNLNIGDTDQILKKLGEIEEQIPEKGHLESINEKINTIAADFADEGRIDLAEKAIRQLEENERKLMGNMEAALARIKRVAWDANGRYRGVFACEDHARQFGLICMGSGKLGRSACVEALKSEYPDIHARAFENAKIKTMTGDDDSAGGALVPTEFYNRIIYLAEEYGVFLGKAFRQPMGSDSGQFPRITSSLTVYCPEEGVAPTASDLASATIQLNTRGWMILTYFSNKLGMDAAASVGEWLARLGARAFAYQADLSGFTGTGSPATYFGVRGIIPAIEAVGTASEQAFSAHDAYSEVTDADLTAMQGLLPQYASMGAEWYGHRKAIFGILIRLARAAGGVTSAEIEGRRRLVRDGDPINIVQVMSSTEADEANALLYGDISMAATWGDRQQLTVKTSDHYKFAEGLTTVLQEMRLAINVHDVGSSTAAGPVILGSLETS